MDGEQQDQHDDVVVQPVPYVEVSTSPDVKVGQPDD
jgi:hypothetical protein